MCGCSDSDLCGCISTVLPLGVKGDKGDKGDPSIFPIVNTVFVDSKYGDDSTGLVERLDKPFKTLLAAQTAAISGYTVWTWPGTYSDFNLGKFGVNWHFVEGCTLTSTPGRDIFIDTGGISYSVSGNAKFTIGSARIVYFTNGGVLTLQGDSIANTTAQAFYTSGTSKLYANFKYSITSNGGLFTLFDTSIQDIITPYVSGSVIAAGIDSGTTFNLRASDIVASGACVFGLPGNANVWGNISYTGSGSGFICTVSSACNQNFYGDIVSSSAALIIEYANANTGVINFYGRIISTGGISINGSLATYSFYNEITTNNGNIPSILQTSGTIKVKSRITNLGVNIASYCIKKTTGTLILEQAILITSGATESVHSDIAENIIVYPGTVAKVAVSANITQLVASILIDNQIQ